MNSIKPTTAWAEIDELGRLVLPSSIIDQFGLHPGAKVRIDEGQNYFRVHRPITHLTKIYIEPTTACNLNCITCFRNNWDLPEGKMSEETFELIYSNLEHMNPVPTIYFGGIGEPLFHQHTLDWIARVKKLGARVELITNGLLLTESRINKLVKAGLDTLWVSIDGATPETYADVRIGSQLPRIIENLRSLARKRGGGHFPKPEIGIAFLAMKRNITDLPKVIRLGISLKARYFSVSNLQPAVESMQQECLYSQTLRHISYLPSAVLPRLILPKMDFSEETRDALIDAFNSGCNVLFAGNNWGGANDVCNFVESGTLSISWNGVVSPCWPLMHDFTSYLHNKPRKSQRHVLGNVRDQSIQEIWLSPAFLQYRERLHNFVFAPCTFCGGCDLSEANVEDCLGNTFPTCGGCLWAQGIVQCP